MNKDSPAPDVDEEIAVEGLDDETNPALHSPSPRPAGDRHGLYKNAPSPNRTTTKKPRQRGVPIVTPSKLPGKEMRRIAPSTLDTIEGHLKMLRALFMKAWAAGDLWLCQEINKTIQNYFIGYPRGKLAAQESDDPASVVALPDDAEFGGDDTQQPDAPIDDDEIEPQPDALPMSRATEQRSVEDRDKQSAAERERRDRDK